MTLKGIETWWKRVSMRALAATMRKPIRDAVPDWDGRPWRVLYIRYGRIGDMIMSTGVMRAIAQSHRTIVLDVLASPVNQSVLEGVPFVRDVIPFDRHDWRSFLSVFRRLRRARYDVVIDPMVLTPSVTTVLLLVASGARYRIGIGGRSNDFVYTMPMPARDDSTRRHHIDQEAVTAAPFGVDLATTDWRPMLALSADERARAELIWRANGPADAPRLLANISASLAQRAWPDDHYVAVLRSVRERWPAVRILLVCAPVDAARGARLATAADASYTSTPNMREALALVGTSSVVFTPDTSIAHAAAAFRKPAVVMLLAGSEIFSPYGNTGRDIYSPERRLSSLGVEPVIAALDDVLSRASAG